MTIPHTRFTDVAVTGTTEQISQALAPLHDAGRLLGMTAPRPVSAADPRQTVRARVRTIDPEPTVTPEAAPSIVVAVNVTQPPATAAQLGHRPGDSSGFPAVPFAVGAGVFVAVAVSGFWIGASGVATHLIATVASVIGGIGALVLLASALLRITSGTGHHCPGCPHH
jgi:hypothetical protein